MKRIIALLLAVMMLYGMAALAEFDYGEPDGYVANGGWFSDTKTYTGTWQQTYRQILNSHAGEIQAYEDRLLEYYIEDEMLQGYCRPVSMVDITGDSIPELLFLELATEERGDLYFYSSNGKQTKCILYVPGITRPDFSGLDEGFDIYLSSAAGGTLVLEYDEYEWPWTLQLMRNALGQYTLANYLRAQYDNSDWSNDQYYVNGTQTDYSVFNDILQTMRSGRTMTLTSYSVEDLAFYGFTLTWEEAVSVVGGSGGKTEVTPKPKAESDGVWGLTIDKLATRKGPGTQYEGGGTYTVKGEYIKVLAKAWDKRNGIWWVKCEIPYRKEIRVLWTGWKRFDHNTISLDDLPEEFW